MSIRQTHARCLPGNLAAHLPLEPDAANGSAALDRWYGGLAADRTNMYAYSDLVPQLSATWSADYRTCTLGDTDAYDASVARHAASGLTRLGFPYRINGSHSRLAHGHAFYPNATWKLGDGIGYLPVWAPGAGAADQVPAM